MRGSSPDSYAYVRQSLTCVRPRDHRQSLRHFAGRRRWLKAPVTTVARSREVVPRAAKAPTGGGSNHEGSRDDDVNCNRGAGGRRRTTRRTGKVLSHLVPCPPPLLRATAHLYLWYGQRPGSSPGGRNNTPMCDRAYPLSCRALRDPAHLAFLRHALVGELISHSLVGWAVARAGVEGGRAGVRRAGSTGGQVGARARKQTRRSI